MYRDTTFLRSTYGGDLYCTVICVMCHTLAHTGTSPARTVIVEVAQLDDLRFYLLEADLRGRALRIRTTITTASDPRKTRGLPYTYIRLRVYSGLCCECRSKCKKSYIPHARIYIYIYIWHGLSCAARSHRDEAVQKGPPTTNIKYALRLE